MGIGRRGRRGFMGLAVGTIVLIVLAACARNGGAGSASTAAGGSGPKLTVAQTSAGQALAGDSGKTLYTFAKDSNGTSACSGGCATTWAPFTVPAGQTVKPGDGVTGSIGTLKRDDGSMQVTYAGHPLYYYAPDAKPGDATGQGVGGVWFIASPSGQMGGGSGAASGSPEPSASASKSAGYGY
ncbi:MAG: COG4315 family predicted lipoprotein [Candidatus Limnocylindria bacterium]